MVRAPDPGAENGLEVTGAAIESVGLLVILFIYRSLNRKTLCALTRYDIPKAWLILRCRGR